MITIKRLTLQNRLKYKSFMFQWLYKLVELSLNDSLESNRFMLIGAESDGVPVGLIVLERRDGDGHAVLQCIFVSKQRRRQKIATLLLREARSLCVENQLSVLSLSYYSGKSSTDTIEALLHKEDWTQPRCESVIFHIHLGSGIDQAAWLRERAIPHGLELFLWADREERQLRQSIEAGELDFPSFLSPFKTFAPLEPSNSFGIQSTQEIQGWSLTYRLDEDTILYDALYIAPEYQQFGLAFQMLGRSIRVQTEAGIPHAMFTVNHSTPVMMKLARQWLAPYSWKTSEKRSCYIRL
ncbi:GNAT family N-acetyltransferase [Paenibacillus sp. FSL R5-0519]|uniref:GNAT family N-acetyltransferase n=1 Tax=Paenibacillus sp. FSL R5-0519 TaxID=2921648 RepID=UPI0030D76F7B